MLIHFGSGSAVRSGLLDNVKKALDDEGIFHSELGAREEDIPALVENQGLGKGRTGGFVSLSANDISEIYKIAAKAAV